MPVPSSVYAIGLAALVGRPGSLPAEPGALAPTELSVRAGGARFRIEEGRLVLSRGGEQETLGTSTGEDPGTIRDLAADPAGLVFVAGEGGLFVTDARSRILDPVVRGPGAPAGVPTSVWVDARRRLWLGTESDWGVLDPSFFWGRSLGGVAPGGGPYRIAAGEGGLRVESAGGVTLYRPDQGPTPRVTEVRVDGQLLAPAGGEALFELDYDDALRLAAEGEGAGGATLRWRVDGHHVWRELAGEVEIAGLASGKHRVEVVALDRDLNRSQPVGFRLEVSFPLRYEPAFVLTAGSVAGALLLGLFLFLERRRAHGRAAWLRALLSTGLALVFAVQVAAGIAQHARAWPFVGFSMYSGRYEEGDHVYRPTLRGLDARGMPRNIPVRAAGVAADSPWQVLRALVDGGDAAARQYLDAYNERFPERAALAGLQACSERVRLTAHGGVDVAPLVLSHYYPGPHDE